MYKDELQQSASPSDSHSSKSDESEDEFSGFEDEGDHRDEIPDIPYVESFDGAGKDYGKARNALEDIDIHDMYPGEREECVYYPFKSEEDFAMAAWLLESGVSMAYINTLLKLPMVCPFSSVISMLLKILP